MPRRRGGLRSASVRADLPGSRMACSRAATAGRAARPGDDTAAGRRDHRARGGEAARRDSCSRSSTARSWRARTAAMAAPRSGPGRHADRHRRARPGIAAAGLGRGGPRLCQRRSRRHLARGRAAACRTRHRVAVGRCRGHDAGGDQPSRHVSQRGWRAELDLQGRQPAGAPRVWSAARPERPARTLYAVYSLMPCGSAGTARSRAATSWRGSIPVSLAGGLASCCCC